MHKASPQVHVQGMFPHSSVIDFFDVVTAGYVSSMNNKTPSSYIHVYTICMACTCIYQNMCLLWLHVVIDTV